MCDNPRFNNYSHHIIVLVLLLHKPLSTTLFHYLLQMSLCQMTSFIPPERVLYAGKIAKIHT